MSSRYLGEWADLSPPFSRLVNGSSTVTLDQILQTSPDAQDTEHSHILQPTAVLETHQYDAADERDYDTPGSSRETSPAAQENSYAEAVSALGHVLDSIDQTAAKESPAILDHLAENRHAIARLAARVGTISEQIAEVQNSIASTSHLSDTISRVLFSAAQAAGWSPTPRQG